ncbi:MAG: carbamate kinase [Elusimicrobia bacterium]|nr:carbamate kinase [Elusimicrobiota bacterium]
MEQELLVVALGGNALLAPHEKGTAQEQQANSARTFEELACLFRPQYSLIFTHGNGPQVGNIVLQNELAGSEVPALPLDVCVAKSEGSMGYFLQQAVLNALRCRRIRRYVVTVITQVLVDRKDPAFQNPNKPIGPFYTPAQAQNLMRHKGWKMVEDSQRGWRRVVPSPKPIKVIQRYMIRDSALIGNIVIAAGGGGIPIIQKADGTYEGVEAVIDKDLSSAVLAGAVKADRLLILTAVPYVCLNFKTPQEKPLRQVTTAELAGYLKEGHFAPGSMKPKIEAALLYLRQGGSQALITDIPSLPMALKGKAGTQILCPKSART